MEQALADAETAADAAVEKLRQQNLERLTSAAERVCRLTVRCHIQFR